jgi:type III restriction enzyme
MLSEGWDTKTVTHIMGLRAFTSQLLCEQVVGRGLRRTSYEVNPMTGLFEPEYVNIFGIPFTFLPHEIAGDHSPTPPKPKTRIFVDDTKRQYELKWPNVIRINHTYSTKLSLDNSKVRKIELRPEDTPLRAELAVFLDGKPDVTKKKIIDLTDDEIERILKVVRKQREIFEVSRDIYDLIQPSWPGNKEFLLIQLVRLVENLIDSDKLIIRVGAYQGDLRKRLLVLLNMNKIVQHIFSAIRFQNTKEVVPVYDKETPIKSTLQMVTWWTIKPCEIAGKSHISHVVFDSSWEATEAFELDRNKHVASWVKNDHLGFVINYVYGGVIHKFYPDFLIKLTNNKMLVIEVKGIDNEQNKVKREFLAEWTRAINADGRFGIWAWDISYRTSDILDIINKHANS